MNFLGIGSGLDLSTMLTKLVQVASEPKVEQLGRREILAEDSISGLGILKSALSDFQTASDALKDAGLYSKMTTTVTQPTSGDIVEIEAEDNAVASNYNIEVVELAAGSKATSDWRSVSYQSDKFADTSADMGKTGTLNFGAGLDVTVEATDSLEELKTKIDALTGIGAKITDGRLEYFAEGTDDTPLTVSSTGDASLSAFTTAGDMTQRATSSKPVNLSGDLTFGADGNTFDVTLDGSETLDEIVAKVNSAEDNFGVTANIIDGKLVYQSSITGVGNDLSVTGDSADLDKLTTEAFGGGAGGVAIGSIATDAKIKVDGVEITNDSNTFDSAVAGLTITALKQSKDAGTPDAETASLSVGDNKADVEKKIETFVSTYNTLREKMNELKGYIGDDDKFVAGKLTNDPVVRNIESVLNRVITSVGVDAEDNTNTLFAIGLEITEDGTLSHSSSDTGASDRWDAAMSGSMDSLKKLFAGDGQSSNDGLADLISDQIDNYVGITGIIAGQESSFQEQLDDLEKEYEAHTRYIESYQATLKQKFTALDSSMAQMDATLKYLTSQLAALPGVAS